jgi:hypothetical protein
MAEGKMNITDETGAPKAVGDFFGDIVRFQDHFGFSRRPPTLAFLVNQLDFLREELDETVDAVYDLDAEKVVDGIVDLIVVACGTLRFFTGRHSGREAWNRVMDANFKKEVGHNASRPNSGGVDLVKP